MPKASVRRVLESQYASSAASPYRRRTRAMGLLACTFALLLALRSVGPVLKTLTEPSSSHPRPPASEFVQAAAPIETEVLLSVPPPPPSPPRAEARAPERREGAVAVGEVGSSTRALEAPPPPVPPPASDLKLSSLPLSPPPPPPRRLRAFIFTMDSLSGVVAAAERGGPAGEIRVRTSLQGALESLGVDCDTVGSDAEMESRVDPSDGSVPHDIIILDEWTLRAPGGGLRSFVRGRESDTYLLAFFGLRGGGVGGDFPLPEDHILTAFPGSLGGEFLGWGYEEGEAWSARSREQCDNLTSSSSSSSSSSVPGGSGGGIFSLPPHLLSLTPCSGARSSESSAPPPLQQQHQQAQQQEEEWRRSDPPLPPRHPRGVVWGKKAEYFEGKGEWLTRAGSLAPLTLTSPPGTSLPPDFLLSPPPPPRSQPHVLAGHLTRAAWRELLAGSSFFLGLGDPLLGPSALDAVAAGCVYINPTFGLGAVGVRSGELASWGSQHPYLEKHLGPPYVCSAPLGDLDALEACVKGALAVDLPPITLPDFTKAAHLNRVKHIFKLL